MIISTLRKIGTIHLNENEGIQVADPVYFGSEHIVHVQLNWPQGDYSVYHEEGRLILMKSDKIEEMFHAIAGGLIDCGEDFGVDSGRMGIAPHNFLRGADSKDRDGFIERHLNFLLPKFDAREDSTAIFEGIATASTMIGDGVYPVFVDDPDSPTIVIAETDHDIYGLQDEDEL